MYCRIGRTGRAGNTGTAITFFQRDIDQHLAIPLVRMLSKARQDVPEWLEGIAGKRNAAGGGGGGSGGGGSGGGGSGNKGGRGEGLGGTGQKPVIGSTELWGNET